MGCSCLDHTNTPGVVIADQSVTLDSGQCFGFISMIYPVAVRRRVGSVEFVNEAALETFIWDHLPELLQLQPLQRQFICQGEVCDILAVDEYRSLVILELKNGEDRYIIQQLTRYYANLVAEKPFADEIDYERPVRLLAIAPGFHRHNLIDRDYSRLSISLIQFRLIPEASDLNFQLQTVEGDLLCKQLIEWQEFQEVTPGAVPAPPELLLNWLSGCTPIEREKFLELRSQLLMCSDLMKERVEPGAIYYGTSGTSHLCGEIRYSRTHQKPVLFLWLPTPSSYIFASRPVLDPSISIMIGRLRCWITEDMISHVGHVPEGFGRMQTETEWAQVPKEKKPKRFVSSLSSKSHMPIDVGSYLGTRQQDPQPDYWDLLTQMAITAWLQRRR